MKDVAELAVSAGAGFVGGCLFMRWVFSAMVADATALVARVHSTLDDLRDKIAGVVAAKK